MREEFLIMDKTVILSINFFVMIAVVVISVMHIHVLYIVIGMPTLTLFFLPDVQSYRFRMMSLVAVQSFLIGLFYEFAQGEAPVLYSMIGLVSAFLLIAFGTAKHRGSTTKEKLYTRWVTCKKDHFAISIFSLGIIVGVILISLLKPA